MGIRKNTKKTFDEDYFKNLGIQFLEDIGDFIANRAGYEKFDDMIVDKLSAMMEMIPEILIGKSLDGDTYRVIYDKGLGTLQMAANNPGMFRGNVVAFGTNNDIKQGVLLQKVSMGPQLVGLVFAAMTMATSQYYFSRINKELHSVERKISEIQEYLDDDKRSVMESEEEFLKNIQINCQSILENDEFRNASLCSIQRIKMDSLSNIIFYKKQIGDLKKINIKKDKIEDILSNIQQINYMISGYWFSLYLYSSASCLEPIIGKIYDKNYIGFVRNDISEKCSQYKADFESWNEKLEEYINATKAFDENKILKAIEVVGPRGGVVFSIAGVIANVANSVDKKKKLDKKEEALDGLKDNKLFSDIKDIEAKMDDLALFDVLSNHKLEIIKYNNEMYFKTYNES